MASVLYLNVNYVCNERCDFCAAELANGALRVKGHAPWVTLDEVREWLGDERPAAGDTVLLAGGEPTLHRELVPIVRLLAAAGPDVVLFTNGLRLVDGAFALELVAAGVTRFEVPLYGARAASHDAITRRAGSFERTLAALETLAGLPERGRFTIDVRLLVSRQCSAENPGAVRLVRERVPGVDSFSLNRLLLSDDARASDAPVSYAEARASINEAARLAREGGYELRFDSLPLCVFDGDNAAYVRERTGSVVSAADGDGEAAERFRYLDPFVAARVEPQSSLVERRAWPAPCRTCAYGRSCRGVAEWYVERFGAAGLESLRKPAPSAALAP